ncbi:MAG: uroporphyrinogen decarboxylase family protein [Treponema sp.]|nr:uroporphyrinogen decarboxylase family protein [Treponema sp.]
MTSAERFNRTIARRDVDRPARWLGIPDERALPGLFAHFGVSGVAELRLKLGDDLFPVELPYDSPYSRAIYNAFDFQGGGKASGERTLTRPGYFSIDAGEEDVDRFDWPEPERYIDPAACERAAAAVPRGKAVLGVLWSAHFQDACAAFGMENAFLAMYDNPAGYELVNNKILDFYLRANKVFYENTRGRLDAVLIGNDMGSQQGLMLSAGAIRRFVMPGAKALIEQAHGYGVKVMYHSCGSIRDIIGDLINAGADAIHPIQALAEGMEPASLKRDFGDRVSFCGGVDAQNLLICGEPAMIREKVAELRRIFPTGLVISPSHEAILPDIPPVNIEYLFYEE